MSKKLFTILAIAICINANAQVCFSPATNFTVGQSPMSICDADFNGDGKIDLATANSHTNTVSVLLGTGNGTFNTATTFTVGGYPHSLTSADFNGDGNADLATSNQWSTGVTLLFGNGAGGFTNGSNFPAGMLPLDIIHADFNGDGKADLATTNWYSSRLFILLGNGAGSFGLDSTSTIPGMHYSLISGDFNSDGKPDLATADSGSKIYVLPGNGNGSFGPATGYTVGNSSSFLTSADFNGDGKTDLAGGGTFVLLGTGTGSFGAPTAFYLGGDRAIISKDFNGDGKTDVAVTDNWNQIHLAMGNGLGSLGPVKDFIVGSDPEAIISADFNNDGKPDVAIANAGSNNISVLLNMSNFVSVTATPNTICSGTSCTLTAIGSISYTWSTSDTTATISVTPTVTTTYSVTDGNGCSNTASTTINVAIAATPEICMVTTDSASNYNYNIIYWDKTLYPHVDSFIVYRYDVMSSNYLRIGAVSKNSLSEFKDTAFSIGGPNGGNPLYSSWQYKLAIRDTCGNIGVKSPYHQSMFVQESGATFSWNAYTVEAGQSNPVTGYSFLRDNNNTGSWHVLVNTAGLSSTDPNYASFPNGNWRVDALGFNCTPTLMLTGNNNNTLIASKKSHSNTSRPTTVGINQISNNNNPLSIFPNPSNNNITIQSASELVVISIYNSLGEKVKEAKTKEVKVEIDISNLPAGIYILLAQGKYMKLIKE